MLTPKYPIEQFPALKSATNNFLDYKTYRTLSWKRNFTVQILVLLAIMVAIAMGKAQSSSVLWPELSIGTYLVLFRGPRSLIAIALGELFGLLLHHINIYKAVAMVSMDLLFIIALVISLKKILDKIIAFKDARSRLTLMAAAVLWLVPYSLVMTKILPYHSSWLAIIFAASIPFFTILPAALIWERFVPQKDQFEQKKIFLALMITACVSQVLTSYLADTFYLILDGISMLIILIMTHKAWGQQGSSLLLAITTLTLALAWHA